MELTPVFPQRKTYVAYYRGTGQIEFREVEGREHDLLDCPPCTTGYYFCELWEAEVDDPDAGGLVIMRSGPINPSPLYVRKGRLARRGGIFGFGAVIIVTPRGIEPTHEVIVECPDCQRVAYAIPCNPADKQILILEKTAPDEK